MRRIVTYFVISILASARWAVSAEELQLPTPDGIHAVGKVVQEFRDSIRRRELAVTFWYPARTGDNRAAYMDAIVARAAADYWDIQPAFAEHTHAHAYQGVPVASDRPFPVVLLEHGTQVVPEVYTTLAEGLASNGFIVVAINHPSDSLVAAYRDGHVVKFVPYWPEKADRKTRGEAMTKHFESILVPDVRFVLDQLDKLNATDPFWRGGLSLGRLAIIGHSAGATVAMIAAQRDKRIKAVVNLDGSTFPGMSQPFGVSVPLLFLMTEEHATGTTHGREFFGRKTDTYYVVLGDAEHLSFTDSHMLTSTFFRRPSPDNDILQRATRNAVLARILTEEFLGKYLFSRTAPILDSKISVVRQ